MSHRIVAAGISFMLLFSSCYQNIHFADRANSPGFTRKGEAKIASSIKPQNNDSYPNRLTPNFTTSGFSPEIDVAYAFTDHLALTAGYTSVLNRYVQEGEVDLFSDSSIGGQIQLNGAEIGAGYFDKLNNAIKYGIYGSIGTGGINRRGVLYPQYDYKTRFYKFSIQPEFGVAPNGGKLFSFTTGFRTTMMTFSNFKSSNSDTKYVVGYYPLNGSQHVANQVFFYLEPYANIEVGYKYIKFNVQAGVTTGIGAAAADLGQTPYASAGIVLHYNPDY